MAKQRTLSEAEEAARKACGGLTRRQWRAKNSKFANAPMKTSSGNFEVIALFDGNLAPQAAPFPNLSAALARFERLSSNPSVRSLKIVETQIVRNSKGEAVGTRPVALYSLTKNGQEFCNSKISTIYTMPGENSMLTMKAIKASPRLTDAMLLGKLEVLKHQAEGGEAWWERRQ